MLNLISEDCHDFHSSLKTMKSDNEKSEAEESSSDNDEGEV